MTTPSPPAPPPAWWVVRTTALVVLTVTLLAALATIASVLALVFVAAFVAVGIEPLVARLEQRGLRRGAVLAGLAAALAVAVTGVVLLIAVPVSHQLEDLVEATPAVLDSVAEVVTDDARAYLEQPATQERAHEVAAAVLGGLDGLLGSLFGAVGGVMGFALSAATVAVMTVYFSLAMPRMRANAHALLGDAEKAGLFDEMLGKVGAYVTGQALVCVCAGVVSFVALFLLGVPYAGVLAVLVLALDAIPQVGAFLGALVAVAVALTEDLGTALAVAAFFAVYQLVENNLIAPRVFSSVISLTPLTTFLAILVGAGLAGVLGAVAALPLTAAGLTWLRYRFADDPRTSGILGPRTSPTP
ncbi:MAG: AI-2E family transporter [Nocardioides sp.]|uniref:AI-2E family transporter n=1 Tax=Nocardioides sp. TaxID=35761 RepID=UPI003F000DB8